MSARSFLILEELSEQHDAKADANHALAAGHGSGNSGSTDQSRTASSNDNTSGAGGSRNRPQKSNKGRGRGQRSGNTGGGGTRPQSPAGQWTAGYNPWTGYVQAWPAPFRAPGADVLGPRPQFQPQQAMTASQIPLLLYIIHRVDPSATDDDRRRRVANLAVRPIQS
ncbi:hypothetical protein E2562_016852 [Oryza meyeriana var. granulata]|uniref:Uncharacterized protein n=1 Tax=Oryza meyeriana var. granulata TaxID=110450 RepID=A0A6G1BW22_9ORYZ|nr:hypothetical protein E2562_016852 [Oryza meyeriana var. granulata]